ncbi:MAG: ATP-binding cassette domain-containing protein [Lachnospiraceae bacterium]|nr:ATP-binding cassette domain-containing protein [Lachnospiraceae bacterium]
MSMMSVWFFIQDSMELSECIVMMISSFIMYTGLDNAGMFSSLLRVVDFVVDKAKEILELPEMDIEGMDVKSESFDIDVENVTFSYDKKVIIDDLSVHIPEKTTTAIVGLSGGGKTTLCHLIARFWDVDKGKVTLGGRDIKEYSMDSLMKNFSFVFQNVYLFQDTIANNIRFGQPEASMEQVIEAAKKACCHDFIMRLPNGYETVIGEGGASLSGGEKQRISIARAIMKDAPIIILDEATANVDPENEKELVEAIDALTKEKTILMIAHRLKTVRNADQILVIDKGRIAEQGKHEELMKKDGIYKRFVNARETAGSWKLNI